MLFCTSEKSSTEQAADDLEAGAWHSIHIHSVEMKGGRRKLHIVNFTICVTHQIPGHAEAQIDRGISLQVRRSPISLPTVFLT